LRRKDIIHRIIETLDVELRGIARNISIVGALLDALVIEPCEPTTSCACEWTEMLEARASELALRRVQKIASPEALACDRSIRLTIHPIKPPAMLGGLRKLLRDDEHVPIGIRIDRARSKRLPGKLYGVIVRTLIFERCACGSR